MNPFSIVIKELRHRWQSSLLTATVLAAIAGALAFYAVNRTGFQSELHHQSRNVGHNVIILPVKANPFEFFRNGEFVNELMNEKFVQQLVEGDTSLDQLTSVFARETDCEYAKTKVKIRVVGIAASIPTGDSALLQNPMLMQNPMPRQKIQLGSSLAKELGINPDASPDVEIEDKMLTVARVNKPTGTWRDSVVLMDLKAAQKLFNRNERLSRIEAIETTDETGQRSTITITKEIRKLGLPLQVVRRQKVADSRQESKELSQNNLGGISRALRAILALAVIGIASINVYQRTPEVQLLQTFGHGPLLIAAMFVTRSVLLTFFGAITGVALGSIAGWFQCQSAFPATGPMLMIDWNSVLMIAVVATLVAGITSCIVTMIVVRKQRAVAAGEGIQ